MKIGLDISSNWGMGVFWHLKVRVPTSSGNHGNPGKSGKKSFMHGKIMEFEKKKNLNKHGKIMEFCEII